MIGGEVLWLMSIRMNVMYKIILIIKHLSLSVTL